MAGERSEPGVPSETERRAERRIGTTVGKYRIERILGVGGMACVYLAVHRNGHKVAIKMLHAEVSVDADLRARFVREGYAANAIDHRGVVRVLDDDETEDGSGFLVMELLDGETLAARTKRAGRLPVREALALGHQLLDVVAAAHAKGVVHRDIKPENLFVTPDGVLKVLDFGIARMRAVTSSDSEPTHTGRAMVHGARAGVRAGARGRRADRRLLVRGDALHGALGGAGARGGDGAGADGLRGDAAGPVARLRRARRARAAARGRRRRGQGAGFRAGGPVADGDRHA